MRKEQRGGSSNIRWSGPHNSLIPSEVGWGFDDASWSHDPIAQTIEGFSCVNYFFGLTKYLAEHLMFAEQRFSCGEILDLSLLLLVIKRRFVSGGFSGATLALLSTNHPDNPGSSLK
jgi:hypothetical protein